MKETRILVAGSGGQGIIFLGRLIAYAGMLEGREVTFFPSYGAEMRGGTANCTVILSDEMIGSPIVKNVDILIAMNEASLKRFLLKIRSGGVLIYDSSLIKTPEPTNKVISVGIPASRMSSAEEPAQQASATHVSHVKSANMLMLGALIAKTGILKTENAIKALERLTSSKRKHTLDINKEAILKGVRYVYDKKSKNN